MQPERYKQPEATNLPKRDIWKVAEQFASKVGFRPGMEVEPVIAALNGTIVYQAWDEWVKSEDGSIEVHAGDPDRTFTIYLSNFTGPLRNRFTVAHELGHFVLHAAEGQRPIRAARSGSSLSEREANNFAAAFLMPEPAFREAWAQTKGNLYTVAAKFLVSPAAADVRKQQLNLS